jgi:hypothetical protein
MTTAGKIPNDGDRTKTSQDGEEAAASEIVSADDPLARFRISLI